MSSNAVVCEAVDFGYTHSILHSVEFTLRTGEFVAVLGKNGSGKTTLLRLISRILHPTKGTISTPPVIGWKGCDLPSYCPFSVEEIIHLHPPHVHPRSPSEIQHIISQFSLTPLISRALETLSSGEQHRVLLARLFCGTYPAIVIDEPLTALDPRQQAILSTELVRFVKTGGLVVVASHDVHWVASTCQRAFSVKNGAVSEISASHVITPEFQRIYD
jgi:ABC-type Mn2+/Zn2+ transport system ATPase subunit